MSYEAALQRWGSAKLAEKAKLPIDQTSVEVDLVNRSEWSYGCESCSYEDKWITVNITGYTTKATGRKRVTVDYGDKYNDINLSDLIKEVISYGETA